MSNSTKKKFATYSLTYILVAIFVIIVGQLIFNWSGFRLPSNVVKPVEVPEDIPKVSLSEILKIEVSPRSIDYGCPVKCGDFLVWYDDSGEITVVDLEKAKSYTTKIETGNDPRYFMTDGTIACCSTLPKGYYLTLLGFAEEIKTLLIYKLRDGSGKVSYVYLYKNHLYIFYEQGLIEEVNIKDGSVIFSRDNLGFIGDGAVSSSEDGFALLGLLSQNEAPKSALLTIKQGSAVTSERLNKPLKEIYLMRQINKNFVVLIVGRESLIVISPSGKVLSEKKFAFQIEELKIKDGKIYLYGRDGFYYYNILNEDLEILKEDVYSELPSYLLSDDGTFYGAKGESLIIANAETSKTLTLPSEIYLTKVTQKYIYLSPSFEVDRTTKEIRTLKEGVMKVFEVNGSVFFTKDSFKDNAVEVTVFKRGD